MPRDQVVRSPLRVRRRSGRALDQRLAIRFPRLASAWPRLVAGLSPSSRLRQAFFRRAVRLSLEAYNRRDLDAVVLGFHPDLEYHPYREFVDAGLAKPCYRGPAGYREYIESTYDVWGSEVQLHPMELIDLGDRLVVLADMPMRAQASGVALDEAYGSVWGLRDGRVVHVRDFLRHDKALEAAGLKEQSDRSR